MDSDIGDLRRSLIASMTAPLEDRCSCGHVWNDHSWILFDGPCLDCDCWAWQPTRTRAASIVPLWIPANTALVVDDGRDVYFTTRG